jgi:hypothetical protein
MNFLCLCFFCIRATKCYNKSDLAVTASGDIGLDADLAQALRVFFKDMKTVQGQISELKDFGMIYCSDMNSNVQKFSLINRKLLNVVEH